MMGDRQNSEKKIIIMLVMLDQFLSLLVVSYSIILVFILKKPAFVFIQSKVQNPFIGHRMLAFRSTSSCSCLYFHLRLTLLASFSHFNSVVAVSVAWLESSNPNNFIWPSTGGCRSTIDFIFCPFAFSFFISSFSLSSILYCFTILQKVFYF